MSKEIRDVNLYSASKAIDDINDEDQAVTFGKNNGLKIAEMVFLLNWDTN